MKQPVRLMYRGIIVLVVATTLLLATLLCLLFIGAHGSVGDLIAGNRQPAITIPDTSVSWPASTDLATLTGLGDTGPVAGALTKIQVDPQAVLTKIDPAYLSVAVDAAQVTGAAWWKPEADTIESNSGSTRSQVLNFNRPGLEVLAAALAPAYLRIGGSEADRVWYALDNSPQIPNGYGSVLSRTQWDNANAFAEKAGLRLVFTLNAGPAPRKKGIWDASNALALVRYSSEHQYPVAVWELGNELNGYWFIHGLRHMVSPLTYADELASLEDMVHTLQPGAQVAGQGSAFWPVIGEPFSVLTGYTQAYLQASARVSHSPDIVLWHYYPQQSRRAPAATRRASPGRLLDPAALDEAAFWAQRVGFWAKRYAPRAPVWLGETGNAQFGGEPGVSDRWIGSLWWLDQLGLLATKGTQVMIRQTLLGMDYGLLDSRSLQPRPDYWVSLVWKRLMGNQVLSPQHSGGKPTNLRVYAQSAGPKAPTAARVSLLAINLDTTRATTLQLPVASAQAWFLNASNVLGSDIRLNGKVLQVKGLPDNPTLPPMDPVAVGKELVILPLSVVFVVW